MRNHSLLSATHLFSLLLWNRYKDDFKVVNSTYILVLMQIRSIFNASNDYTIF
jgi:hypothetical protein